ncbi:MAG: homoserine kinase [Gammaproteobacteria bacterium]|nr:homoserine kinase [Gammaproteobacteria bacterium]
MSVYTRISSDQLQTFLSQYRIGELLDYAGIVAGITNTNYALQTTTGAFVLTLYEHHSEAVLDYILGLQHHLASKRVACAAPVLDCNNRLYSTLNQRPTAIIHRLAGEVCKIPTRKQCAQMGAELARFHLAGTDFLLNRDNPCGSTWMQVRAAGLDTWLSLSDKTLLHEEIRHYTQYPLAQLPQGTLHADLFHDNVLFDGGQLSGIIDFDYACNDVLIYDLCVTINDWCILTDGNIDTPRMDALLQAYHQLRPLLEAEREALPALLRIAALRFWVSRLHDKTFPDAGEITFAKDPDEFKRMLLLRREQEAQVFDL